MVLCEFEVYRDRGGKYRAVPFGMAGELSGNNYRDVCIKSAEWLKVEAEALLADDKPLPEPPLGNFPKAGGRVLLVAVEPKDQSAPSLTYAMVQSSDVNGDDSGVVTASQAAEMLGVSRSRISQMTRSGALEGYRRGRDAYVTVASINARLANPPRRGRPTQE